MKAAWLFEKPDIEIDDLDSLADELPRFAAGEPETLHASDLLANIQLYGGWEDPKLCHSGLYTVIENLDKPELIPLLHCCDSRIFEGECGKLLWAKALEEETLKNETLENLLRYVERPASLASAPFDWFVANHSDWPWWLLKRFGMNPECAAPPPARFLNKLLSYEIPAPEHKVFAETWAIYEARGYGRRQCLLLAGEELADRLPMKSILATFAQELMSERFNLNRDISFLDSPLPCEKFSPAARECARERFVMSTMICLWGKATSPSDGRAYNPKMLADFEKCIFEEIPELRDEEYFLWFLDMAMGDLADSDRNTPGAETLSFERLRGGSIREKPIVERVYFTGALAWPATDQQN